MPQAQQPRLRQVAEALCQAAWLAVALPAQVLLEEQLLRDGLHVQLQVGGLEDVQLETTPMPEGPDAPLVPATSSRPPEAGASLPSMRRRGPRQELLQQAGVKTWREP